MVKVYVLFKIKIPSSQKLYYTEKILDNWTASINASTKFYSEEEAMVRLDSVVDGQNLYNIEWFYCKDTRKSNSRKSSTYSDGKYNGDNWALDKENSKF